MGLRETLTLKEILEAATRAWRSPSAHLTVKAWEGNFQRWNNPVVRERARQSLARLAQLGAADETQHGKERT